MRKYLPQFKYRLDGLDESEHVPSMDDYPITISQLASHTSGLGNCILPRLSIHSMH